NDSVQKRRPCDPRNFHDARIGQEFGEITSNRRRRRRVRRAEIRNEDADLRQAAVLERRLGTKTRGQSSRSRDNAFESSFAVTSTIGRSEEHTSELQSLAYLVCR